MQPVGYTQHGAQQLLPGLRGFGCFHLLVILPYLRCWSLSNTDSPIPSSGPVTPFWWHIFTRVQDNNPFSENYQSAEHGMKMVQTSSSGDSLLTRSVVPTTPPMTVNIGVPNTSCMVFATAAVNTHPAIPLPRRWERWICRVTVCSAESLHVVRLARKCCWPVPCFVFLVGIGLLNVFCYFGCLASAMRMRNGVSVPFWGGRMVVSNSREDWHVTGVVMVFQQRDSLLHIVKMFCDPLLNAAAK